MKFVQYYLDCLSQASYLIGDESSGRAAVVRPRPGEYAQGSVEGSAHIPLAQLRERLGELYPARPVVTFCAGGYRSSIAASLLRASGFAAVSDLIGGYQAWQAAA